MVAGGGGGVGVLGLQRVAAAVVRASLGSGAWCSHPVPRPLPPAVNASVSVSVSVSAAHAVACYTVSGSGSGSGFGSVFGSVFGSRSGSVSVSRSFSVSVVWVAWVSCHTPSPSACKAQTSSDACVSLSFFKSTMGMITMGR